MTREAALKNPAGDPASDRTAKRLRFDLRKGTVPYAAHPPPGFSASGQATDLPNAFIPNAKIWEKERHHPRGRRESPEESHIFGEPSRKW